MESLPPVWLGINLLAAYTLAFAVRFKTEARLVESVGESRQPQRQFVFDLSFSLGAGLAAALLNILMYGFPALSTLSLVYGTLIYGFFIALDMALDRERRIILKALKTNAGQPPPKRLYSMTRRFSLVAVAAAVCLSVVNLSVIARDMSWLAQVGTDPAATRQAILSVTLEILFIAAVLLALVINLIVSYSRNLKLLFENETSVLERVSRGDLSRMVPVATRDEFGLIAGHTNHMIAGLRHRFELIASLKLAEEVQRNLLPAGPPRIPGLDIAGTSIYCDETGGDYYDYLPLAGGRVGVVVADVSGHGVDAALFMASARAFLIAKANAAAQPARLVEEVNRHLARDGAPTGRFMSMFLLEIDPAARSLRWVRAGHEPAVIYDPHSGAFSDLGGQGMALGVDAEARYQDYERQGWEPGTVLVIGTDGITETRSAADELFGDGRVRELIRSHAGRAAAEIQSAVIDAVQAFRGQAPQEDDVTLVVVKLL
ncbi:MAG: SpoIIE family protein phosphatase [Desulfobacterales bacterium]|jgi:sigma-B regulation protein RsbU (phosphoserine phosphatase)|nr:SpoIIE family protein phosphatase [Desulfobacterales bacterium]